MVDEKIYNAKEVVSFAKITGEWGGFSNMSYSALFVNETFIPSVEALYQCCKYPLYPEIQKEIISQDNAMKAKHVSRNYSKFQRQDWETIKYSIMRWSLMVKLIQDWDNFSFLLRKTTGKQIVEFSCKDTDWGTVPYGKNLLRGRNILGRLLMELRDTFVLTGNKPQFVPPLNISSFQLFGINIGRVYPSEYYDDFVLD